MTTTLTEEGELRHLDAPHFCATKLEAFASRADGDYYHHDIEDFIAIVDERSELIDEIEAAPKDVRDFLATTMRDMLAADPRARVRLQRPAAEPRVRSARRLSAQRAPTWRITRCRNSSSSPTIASKPASV